MKNSRLIHENSCSPTQWILQLAANKVIISEGNVPAILRYDGDLLYHQDLQKH